MEKDFIVSVAYQLLRWYLSSGLQPRSRKLSESWFFDITILVIGQYCFLIKSVTGNCASDSSLLTVPWVYNLLQIKTMLPGEHQQVLSNLQSRFDDFVEDSQESKIFTSSDTAQLEREVNVCKQYYQELLKSAERGKTLLRRVERCCHERDCSSW